MVVNLTHDDIDWLVGLLSIDEVGTAIPGGTICELVEWRKGIDPDGHATVDEVNASLSRLFEAGLVERVDDAPDAPNTRFLCSRQFLLRVESAGGISNVVSEWWLGDRNHVVKHLEREHINVVPPPTNQ